MRKEILLSYFPKITSRRYQSLLAAFENLERVWQAGFAELKKSNWEEKIIQEFIDWRGQVDEEKIARILAHENIHCIFKDEEAYPKLLKEIYDPPFCLFVRGTLSTEDFALGVVGTRKFSLYGKQITEEIVGELAQSGLTIISGLALGIDGIAHEATLRVGGKTIAVLGSGINKLHIYPAQHKKLSEEILEKGGALISEYPPGTLPTVYTFPRRNRIVAGLTLGTLVIEAPEGSGALITAQCAADNNREVFAVPQNINVENSVGPNNLLKNGAHLITCATDILEILNLQEVKKFVTNREIIPDSPTEAKILENLTHEPIHVDELIKKSALDSSTINATLILMEMKGKVRNLGGMTYVLGR
jgi:DNA processing protein